MNKKIALMVMAISISSPCLAEVDLEPLLNKVTFQLEAEQWITTKSALVNVNINASVTDQAVEKIQNEVLEKLKLLSTAGEWHIISFDRREDKSGLENIVIVAQARLPQTELGNLRGKAKSISIPGTTFTIDSVQFFPSDIEIQQANIQLRNSLYQQAKAEIDLLNKSYPEQKFYLHQISFSQVPSVPMPMNNQPMFGTEAARMSIGSVAASMREPSQPLVVGNKQRLYSTVVIASMPNILLQQLQHQS